MKRITLLIALSVGALLTGHASDAVKPPPSADVARIHIYRRDLYNIFVNTADGVMQPKDTKYSTITIDGRRRGDLNNINYITVDVPKGKHTLSAVGHTPHWPFMTRTIEQDFEGGKEYFIVLQIYMQKADSGPGNSVDDNRGPLGSGVMGANMLSLRFEFQDAQRAKKGMEGCTDKTVK